MIHDFSDLPAILREILAAAPCPLVAWLRFTGAAALTLAVVALELWLRVPVRPVFNQLLGFERAPAARAI
jgi:hypothetical protein